MNAWHAITVRPQREGSVARRLEHEWPIGCGHAPEVYVPSYESETGRRLPLLAGYVLASFGLEQRRWICGDGRIVHRDVIGILPGPVTDTELALLRAYEAAGASPCMDPLRVGDTCFVRVNGVTVEAEYKHTLRNGKIVLKVEMFGQKLDVPFDPKCLRKTA